jgi:hypothetical protein
MQVNAQLDPNGWSGTLPLVILVGTKYSQTLSVSVQ